MAKQARKFSWPWRFIWQLLTVMAVCTLVLLIYLDAQVRDRFDGHRWALPAKVYARPLELYVGKQLAAGQLQYELQQLGYRAVQQVRQPGQYQLQGDQLAVYSRGFHFTDASETGRLYNIRLQANRVLAMQSAEGQTQHLVRLEPQLIGGIYPAHNEDRELVQLSDLPNGFVQILLAVEDRAYYEHLGVSPSGIARAMFANIKAGKVVQGGSTLTQQLVKNFYLSDEQTLWRKLQEAPMAMLLNSHYSKDEILEVYLNEVFLGQQGKRAIHGFGLGSWYYFGQPLKELQLHQAAMLVGMIKGPSYYNPKRFPDRAKQRRDLVLSVLATQGLISQSQMQASQNKPLQLSEVAQFSRYPAYMDLVRQQLQQAYKANDLSSHGLRIFTTINPWAQQQANQSMQQGMQEIVQRHGQQPKLQGALVLSQRDNGEVLAVVGDRDAGYAGRNWALDTSRQVGSLIKPVIHLTALSSGRYHLLSPVDDAPLRVPQADGSQWQPANYDGKSHGVVPMYEALVKSYNIANVRLGMGLGVDKVLDQLARLGANQQWQAYPSRLLGALEMSPLKVNQVYQSLASNGFYSPLSVVRDVTEANGQLLSHYPYQVRQAADPQATYLLQQELALVGRQGTGRGAYRYVPKTQTVAGKTGTTNDQRDSWFSGFSGRHVATVWMGNEDASPTPLTGASGALPVWARLMAKLPYQEDAENQPAGVDFFRTNPTLGTIVDAHCPGLVLPFSALRPAAGANCGN
ncbi:MAG TPA: penicillin-binding protein 1B [Oceanospirillaceae bacterium]|nr:penicillin-binding protein 1B [Oceanospirillaceae bacterium]